MNAMITDFPGRLDSVESRTRNIRETTVMGFPNFTFRIFYTDSQI